MSNRSIIIVGHGPSCKVLEDNIGLFAGKNVLWASLNRFYIPEDDILSKIGKVFDLIWCSSPRRLGEDTLKARLAAAVKRGSTIFATNDARGLLTYAPATRYSDFGYGFSSIFAFLCALLAAHKGRIFLVGFDGHVNDVNTVYYGQGKISDDFSTRLRSINRDTRIMNQMFWDYVEYSMNINDGRNRVFNLEGSALTSFKYKRIDEMAQMVG